MRAEVEGTAAGRALVRPAMPAAPMPVRGPAPIRPGRERLTLGALPADVVETLREWGEDSSATAVLVAMVRELRDRPELAPARARVWMAAGELARERRAR